MTFVGTYRDRPDTLKSEGKVTKHDEEMQMIVNGDVYSLNDFKITVWADGVVTAQRKYHVTSSPDKHFPNMTVMDGSINLPIEDLVEFILARITPLELAEGILADDEARERLIDCLGSRYASPGFENADRRKWLAQVQEAVHSVALDKAIEKLNRLEETNRAKSDTYRWHAVQLGHYTGLWKFANDLITQLFHDASGAALAMTKRREFDQCHTTPESLKEYIESMRDPVMKENTGGQWQESRDFWRKELLKVFAPPTIPPEEEEEDPVI